MLNCSIHLGTHIWVLAGDENFLHGGRTSLCDLLEKTVVLLEISEDSLKVII